MTVDCSRASHVLLLLLLLMVLRMDRCCVSSGRRRPSLVGGHQQGPHMASCRAGEHPVAVRVLR